MTDNQEKSLGEIGRTLDRLELSMIEYQADSRTRFHDLADRITVALGPISTHTYQIENQQKTIDRLDGDVKAISTNAARVSGAIGTLTIVATVILDWVMGKR